MGRKKSRKAEARPAPPTVGRGRAVALVVIVALAVVLAFVTWRKAPAPEVTSAPPDPATAPSTRPSRATKSAEPTGEAPAGLGPLLGEWLRPDGGYVLAVRSIAEDGEATVDYSNPRSIHVQRARATAEGGSAELFVELRDQGYPGSTYTLTYDPAADQLTGVYFQAVQRASYDVVFVRR